MAAKRCSICGINYPDDLAFPNCQVCDEGLVFLSDADVDEDWIGQVESKLNPEGLTTIEEVFLIVFTPEEQEDSIYPHKADNKAWIVTDAKGFKWVKHQALVDCGYLGVEPGIIVYLNELFYEVEGYDHEKQRWWVQEIDPEKEFADLPVLGQEPDGSA